MKSKISVTFAILFVFYELGLCHQTVEQSFISDGVVPDVIKQAPSVKAEVNYKDSGKHAALGNELTPTQVRKEPEVKYNGDSGKFYTLIMTDPDAPSRKDPKNKEWQHWLVVNIPGSDVKNGETLAAYVGSGPPKGTGLHRYVFVVYEQQDKQKFDEPIRSDTNGNRSKFSTENFAAKYKLGNPIAGNYFQAKYDDSVPALHKKLGF